MKLPWHPRYVVAIMAAASAVAYVSASTPSPSASAEPATTTTTFEDNVITNWQQHSSWINPMREFEDLQADFSFDRAAATAAMSNTDETEMDILDLKTASTTTAPSTSSSSTAEEAEDQEEATKDDVVDDNDDSSASANQSPTDDSLKRPLSDRWFPPFWDPERSAMVANKQNNGKDEKEDKDKTDDKSSEDDKETEMNKNATKADEVPPSEEKQSKKTEKKKKREKKEKTTKPPQEQPSRQIIVMGGPPPPGGPSRGYSGPPMTPQQQFEQQKQMRKAATSLAAAEVLIGVVGNALRLWFLLWASRHLTSRQETVVPLQHFVFERLNDYFARDTLALQTALQEPPRGISKFRWGRVMRKRYPRQPFFKSQKLDDTFVKTAIVAEVGNDAKGQLDLKHLSDLVTFLLSQHRAKSFGTVQQENEKGVEEKPVDLEIILKVNSPGGSVSVFGLAAAQIERLRRERGITITVCVDQFAASGGYMIASQAHRLIAAPFATVGSIGVIFETLNFHDMLRQYGVQPMVLKAGASKNPITSFGPVTKRDLEHEEVRLAKVHEEFQRFTVAGRPQLKGRERDICDGSVFLGREALRMNLVDALMTSDEYITGKMENGVRVLKMQRSHQSRIPSHARFPSPIDILPHLKNRVVPLIESWASDPDIMSKVVTAGSVLGFARHLFVNHFGSHPPSP